jgi:hypothetical protein
MNRAQVAGLVTQFLNSYDAPAKDRIWQQHSGTFRRFWSERLMMPGAAPLTDAECDVIIRILDCNGKGNTKADEAVAKTMVPQGAWRKLFKGLQANRELAQSVDSILSEAELGRKATLIDQLYEQNKENRNWLTGASGNVLNALLAAYDPVNNLTVIALWHRKAQLDFLELNPPFNWDQAPVGQRIVQSNLLLRDGTAAIGLNGSARTKSRFWYFGPVRELWKPEHTLTTADNRAVSVSVPKDSETEETGQADAGDLRESLQMQATLAEIGATMGFKIWLPRSDRTRVLSRWKPEGDELLEELPLSFDRTLLKTIEEIDVLWIRRRSIIRAFEVEHTTSIYSGLLRMADLLAMQPNLDIKLHIVAPEMRRAKVLSEIKRPVFSLMEGKPLRKLCTYLSYDSITELRQEKQLKRLPASVLDDYEEWAEEED